MCDVDFCLPSFLSPKTKEKHSRKIQREMGATCKRIQPLFWRPERDFVSINFNSRCKSNFNGRFLREPFNT